MELSGESEGFFDAFLKIAILSLAVVLGFP